MQWSRLILIIQLHFKIMSKFQMFPPRSEPGASESLSECASLYTTETSCSCSVMVSKHHHVNSSETILVTGHGSVLIRLQNWFCLLVRVRLLSWCSRFRLTFFGGLGETTKPSTEPKCACATIYIIYALPCTRHKLKIDQGDSELIQSYWHYKFITFMISVVL